MKSFDEWYDEQDTPLYKIKRQDVYNAGAQAQLNALRCETCRHFTLMEKSHRNEHGYCYLGVDSNGGSVVKDFGCIKYQERKT